jgi:hypothetical protein
MPYYVTLDYNAEELGLNTEGWNMEGFIQTSTSSEGVSTLKVYGSLNAPERLSRNYEHTAIFTIGSEFEPFSETFMCGWIPENVVSSRGIARVTEETR